MGIRKTVMIGLIVSCAALPLISSPATTGPAKEGESSITVLFSPGHDCVKAIVEELSAAARSIRVQAYVLTSDAIGDALVSAKRRGLDVQVILDDRLVREAGSEAGKLLDNEIVVRVDGSREEAHSKIMIIDRLTVITGSFDFSDKAQTERADNLLIIKDHPEVARRFNQNWAARAGHSRPYAGAGDPGADAKAVGPNTAGDEELVYVTKSGKRYHTKECRFARDAEGITRSEAIRQGKTPCKMCKPR